MGLVEYDVETESFRTTFDSSRDSTYLAVVALVSTALGRTPLDLTPVQYVTDTDELDELGTDPPTGNADRLSFRYEGFEITVTSEEVIEAKPIEYT